MFAGTDYAALLLNFHPLAILSTKVREVKIVFIFQWQGFVH
jgi:hypothetical protein